MRNRTEAILQESCLKWFRLAYPKHAPLLFAIPNGGSRNKIEAANLKRQGVTAGVADCFFSVPKKVSIGFGDFYSHHGLFIEFKAPKGKQTPEQKNFQIEVEQQGYLYVLINSFDLFKEVIEQYLS